MKVTTLDGIAGHITEETLGVVRGTALWTRRIVKNSMGGIRQFQYHGLQDLDDGLKTARASANMAMTAEAQKMGADAIVGMRLEVIELSNSVFCVNACGTAVRTLKLPQMVPAFTADMPDGGTDGFDFAAARPAFEGSALRH